MIYLASPYSHPDPAVRQQRFEAICRVAADLFRDGEHVFSPIAHSHPLHIHGGLGGDLKFWLKYDIEMMRRCDRFMVAKLDGWEDSEGVKTEIRAAERWGFVVEYVLPE